MTPKLRNPFMTLAVTPSGPKMPVLSTVLSAFEDLGAHWRAALRLSWVWAALVAIFGLLAFALLIGAADTLEMSPWLTLSLLWAPPFVFGLFAVSAAVGWHRLLLLGEDPGVAYARSKRRAEEAAFSVAREGLPLVVVNPSFVLGPGGGEGSSGRIVRRFLDGKMKFYVEGGFSPVDVADVAQGHLAAAEKGRLGERYLLSGENVSFAQFFTVLSEVAGGPMPKRVPGWFALGATKLQERVLSPLTGKPPVADLDEVLMGRLIRYFDNSKARAELAFNPRPLRETLERTVQWMRQAELSRRD